MDWRAQGVDFSSRTSVLDKYQEFFSDAFGDHPKKSEIFSEWQVFRGFLEKGDRSAATSFLAAMNSSQRFSYGRQPDPREELIQLASPVDDMADYIPVTLEDTKTHKFSLFDFLYKNMRKEKSAFMFTAPELVTNGKLETESYPKGTLGQPGKAGNLLGKNNYTLVSVPLNQEEQIAKLFEKGAVRSLIWVNLHLDASPLRQIVDELLLSVFIGFLCQVSESRKVTIFREMYTMVKESIISFDDFGHSSMLLGYLKEGILRMDGYGKRDGDSSSSIISDLERNLDLSKILLLFFKKLILCFANNLSPEALLLLGRSARSQSQKPIDNQFTIASFISKSDLFAESVDLKSSESPLNLVLMLTHFVFDSRIIICEILNGDLIPYSFDREESLERGSASENGVHVVFNRDRFNVFLMLLNQNVQIPVRQLPKKEEPVKRYGYDDFMSASGHSERNQILEDNEPVGDFYKVPYNYEAMSPSDPTRTLGQSQRKANNLDHPEDSDRFYTLEEERRSAAIQNNVAHSFPPKKQEETTENFLPRKSIGNTSMMKETGETFENKIGVTNNGRMVVGKMMQILDANTNNLLIRFGPSSGSMGLAPTVRSFYERGTRNQKTKAADVIFKNK